MKNILIPVFFLITGLIFSQDFGKIKFGMSKSEVIKFEDAKLKENEFKNDKMLFYKTSIYNIEGTYLYYYFTQEDKLYSAVYSCMVLENILKKYKEVNDILAKKYGKPVKYKEQSGGFYALFETKDLTIIFYKEKYVGNFNIMYFSIKYFGKENIKIMEEQIYNSVIE